MHSSGQEGEGGSRRALSLIRLEQGSDGTEQHGLVLSDLPPDIRAKLQPLDTNNDGIVDACELHVYTESANGRIFLSSFPIKLQKELAVFDNDGEGSIDAHELALAARAYQAQRNRSKLILRGALVLAVILMSLVAVMAGVMFVVVDAAKDTEASSAKLADRETGKALRTSTGVLQANMSEVSLFGQAEESTRRRLLQAYLEDDSIADFADAAVSLVYTSMVQQGCELRCDGQLVLNINTAVDGDKPHLESFEVDLEEGCDCASVSYQMTFPLKAKLTSQVDSAEFYVTCTEEAISTCMVVTHSHTAKRRNLLSDAHSELMNEGAFGRRLRQAASGTLPYPSNIKEYDFGPLYTVNSYGYVSLHQEEHDGLLFQQDGGIMQAAGSEATVTYGYNWYWMRLRYVLSGLHRRWPESVNRDHIYRGRSIEANMARKLENKWPYDPDESDPEIEFNFDAHVRKDERAARSANKWWKDDFMKNKGSSNERLQDCDASNVIKGPNPCTHTLAVEAYVTRNTHYSGCHRDFYNPQAPVPWAPYLDSLAPYMEGSGMDKAASYFSFMCCDNMPPKFSTDTTNTYSPKQSDGVTLTDNVRRDYEKEDPSCTKYCDYKTDPERPGELPVSARTRPFEDLELKPFINGQCPTRDECIIHKMKNPAGLSSHWNTQEHHNVKFKGGKIQRKDDEGVLRWASGDDRLNFILFENPNEDYADMCGDAEATKFPDVYSFQYEYPGAVFPAFPEQYNGCSGDSMKPHCGDPNCWDEEQCYGSCWADNIRFRTGYWSFEEGTLEVYETDEYFSEDIGFAKGPLEFPMWPTPAGELPQYCHEDLTTDMTCVTFENSLGWNMCGNQGYVQGCERNSGSATREELRDRTGAMRLKGLRAMKVPGDPSQGWIEGLTYADVMADVWANCPKNKDRPEWLEQYPAPTAAPTPAPTPAPTDAPKSKKKGRGCFPASASVQLESGESKTMEQLRIGDRIAALDASGAVIYSEMWFPGHAEMEDNFAYVQLSTDGDVTVELSEGHYIPVFPPSASSCNLKDAVMTRGDAVKIGDIVCVANGATRSTELSTVRHTEHTVALGLFNPMIAEGTIIVDGVVASVYAHWAFEDLLGGFVPNSWFHGIQHVWFAPFRWAYSTLGMKFFQQLADSYASELTYDDDILGSVKNTLRPYHFVARGLLNKLFENAKL